MPQLSDPHFERSVVLMLEHSDRGSFGLIINQPLEARIDQVLNDHDITWSASATPPLWYGGPVQSDSGWMVYASDGELRLSSSLDDLRALAADVPQRFRLHLGYAGWSAGQIAKEIATGSWLFCDLDLDLLFDCPPDEMWSRAIASLGISASSVVSPAHGTH